jgi:hypothetical protein
MFAATTPAAGVHDAVSTVSEGGAARLAGSGTAAAPYSSVEYFEYFGGFKFATRIKSSTATTALSQQPPQQLPQQPPQQPLRQPAPSTTVSVEVGRITQPASNGTTATTRYCSGIGCVTKTADSVSATAAAITAAGWGATSATVIRGPVGTVREGYTTRFTINRTAAAVYSTIEYSSGVTFVIRTSYSTTTSTASASASTIY